MPSQTRLDATQLDSLRDWSLPLLVAQNNIRIACNCLSLANVASLDREQRIRDAETLLAEARAAINDALAAVRDDGRA